MNRAVLAPVLVGVLATAVVWATPLAAFVLPDNAGSQILNFFTQLLIFTLTFSLGEELGWRGYLLPQLLSIGGTRAMVLVGLVWAAWHMPLIFPTPLYHASGNRLIAVLLFVGTIVATSFFFGYLRLWTGSVWPASLAHTAHNSAWAILGAFTPTSNPVIINEYLAGDNGILILRGTAVAPVWLGRKLNRELLTRRRRFEQGQAVRRMLERTSNPPPHAITVGFGDGQARRHRACGFAHRPTAVGEECKAPALRE